MPTEDQILEKLKDKRWRMENLYLILPEDSNEATPLTLRNEQKKYLETISECNRLIIPKARKLGVSTIIVLDFLDECIFNKNTYCGHLDLKEKDCEKKILISKFAWHNGPKHPNPAIAAIWKGIHSKLSLTTENQSVLQWSNGSRQEFSMSFTGSTPTRLAISEFAVLCDEDPKRADRIVQGTFNAVPKNGKLIIESTMRKKSGACYDIFRLAMSNIGKEGNELSWKMLFFPWYNHPSYQISYNEEIDDVTKHYFQNLYDKYNIKVSKERMAWYSLKAREQGRYMKNEFPSVPEECTESLAHGAIYPEMTTVRMNGKVRKLQFDRQYPIYVSADLGVSDRTALWVVQFSGRDILWHRFYMSGHMSAAQTASKIIKMENDLNVVFNKILLPHDANKRDGSGKTYMTQMVDGGLGSNRITIINRTSNVWNAINWMRDNMNRMYFDSSCDQPCINVLGEEELSGLSCLEAYRTKPTDPTAIFHGTDGNSDGADAARTFAQACLDGIISNRDLADHKYISRTRPKTQAGDFVLI
jgi:hypothetical protein